jgi:hypothetical protein
MWARMVPVGPIVIVVKADLSFFGVGLECFWANAAITILLGPIACSVSRRSTPGEAA